MKYSNDLTKDYFDVGFIIKGQPFNRLFNEFFKQINIEPLIVLSNEIDLKTFKTGIDVILLPKQKDEDIGYV